MIGDLDTIDAMEIYGGSFIAALGRAARKADLENLAKIKIAFSEEWLKYSRLAEDRTEARRFKEDRER